MTSTQPCVLQQCVLQQFLLRDVHYEMRTTDVRNDPNATRSSGQPDPTEIWLTLTVSCSFPQVLGAGSIILRSHRRHRACGSCGQNTLSQVAPLKALCTSRGQGPWTTRPRCGPTPVVHRVAPWNLRLPTSCGPSYTRCHPPCPHPVGEPPRPSPSVIPRCGGRRWGMYAAGKHPVGYEQKTSTTLLWTVLVEKSIAQINAVNGTGCCHGTGCGSGWSTR
jgi:hypothetical protein